MHQGCLKLVAYNSMVDAYSSLGCAMNFRWTMMYVLGDPHVVKETTAEVRRSYIIYIYIYYINEMMWISCHFGSLISYPMFSRDLWEHNFYFLSYHHISSYPMHIISKVYTRISLFRSPFWPRLRTRWDLLLTLRHAPMTCRVSWNGSQTAGCAVACPPVVLQDDQMVKGWNCFFFGICLWEGLFGVIFTWR